MILLAVPLAWAAPFEDMTDATIGTTAEWSNKVELADIDGDGAVDILFANGGDYDTPGDDQPNRLFLNGADGWREATELLGAPDLARVIKARDVDGDGWLDVLVGTTYQTAPRLFLGDGAGGLTEVTSTHLPPAVASIGDLELGDVDADGDLDVVLADWGSGSPLSNAGAPVRLWLGDGTGRFVEASEQMPDVAVRFSWDLELNDIDGDADLDLLVSAKRGSTSRLFRNQGDGTFVDDTKASLPAFRNNYDFEAIDVDGDGDLDLATVNDGPRLQEHLLFNDGTGVFTDVTEVRWPDEDQAPGSDDNVLVWVDYDSDGDPDLLVGSLNAADRILLNDGAGTLSLQGSAFSDPATPGTLGMALADLDGDGRLDAVQAQGEAASRDLVFRGVDIPVDTAPPVVGSVHLPSEGSPGDAVLVRARVHDGLTPVRSEQFLAVVVRHAGGDVPMTWAGGQLWQAWLSGTQALDVEICATDRVGLERCEGPFSVRFDDGDTGGTPPAEPESPHPQACGCALRSPFTQGWWVGLSLLVLLLRRRP